MKRSHFGWVAAGVLTAGSALATVDQSQELFIAEQGSWSVMQNYYGMDRNVALWQSFQAGTSAPLQSVEMYVDSWTPASTIELRLYEGTGSACPRCCIRR